MEDLKQPEIRHREPNQTEDACADVGHGVGPQRGQRTQRQADEQCDHQCPERQFCRNRNTGEDQLEHGRAVEKRDAKVTVDHEGNPILIPEGKRKTTPEGKSWISLCRCGGSVTKPFCDGTHSKIGFIGAQEAVEKTEASSPSPPPLP